MVVRFSVVLSMPDVGSQLQSMTLVFAQWRVFALDVWDPTDCAIQQSQGSRFTSPVLIWVKVRLNPFNSTHFTFCYRLILFFFIHLYSTTSVLSHNYNHRCHLYVPIILLQLLLFSCKRKQNQRINNKLYLADYRFWNDRNQFVESV